MTFKVTLLKELGRFDRRNDRVVAEIVKYGDSPPCINVQTEFQGKDSDEWKRGKRPAYDLDTMNLLLPLLTEGHELLEEMTLADSLDDE